MNCLEFRRHLATEPRSNGVAFLAHREACARCADAHAQALAFDDTIQRVLAVPVPAGLADRVLLRQTTAALSTRRHERRFTLWRMAAVLALGVGVASLWVVSTPAQALPDLAVGHLSHEPYALSARATVEPAQIRALFAARGVELAADPGPVNYLNLCHLGRDGTVHMVVQEAGGPVTIYYVIGRADPGRAVWERNGIKGRSIPAGSGTLVLLGSSDAAFDALERSWTRALGPVPAPAA